MFVGENFASIYLRGMRDKSMRSGTKLARKIQLPDWSTAGNLSNRSSGVQIPRDICTRFGRYLYSTRCSWIIKPSNFNFSQHPHSKSEAALASLKFFSLLAAVIVLGLKAIVPFFLFTDIQNGLAFTIV